MMKCIYFFPECPTVPTKRCNLSPIEQKLQKCGPCGGIPPYPRFIQEKMQAELLNKPEKDPKKDKDGKKGGKDGKDAKDGKGGKDDKGKKKRQAGGAVCRVGDENSPSAVYEDCDPVCAGVLQATKKIRYKEPTVRCNGREEEYEMACDEGELIYVCI